jgi:hypothetical protein
MPAHFDRSTAVTALDLLGLGPLNLELAQRWLDLWQGEKLPSRGALNPTQLVKFLPGLAVLEIHPDDSVRYRIAGTALRAAYGFDPSRRDVMELTPPVHRAARLRRFKEFVAGTVGSSIRLVKRPGEVDIVAQDLVLPLGGVSEDGARAWIFHTSWRPGGADTLRALPSAAVGMADEYVTHALR